MRTAETAAIARLQVIRDDEAGMLLREPRTGRLVAVIFFALLAGVATVLFPDLVAAPILFTGVALWQAVGLLKAHELSIETAERRLIYRHGNRFGPPLYSGLYGPPSADGAVARLAVDVRVHRGDPGLVTSKLRSRRLVLDLELPGADNLDIPCGFPMGPAAAVDQGQGLARRLAVPFRDGTPSEVSSSAGEDAAG